MYQSKFNLKVNFILLIFIVLNVAVANESRPQKLRFKHLTVDQGLSHTGVFDILKDKYNFMWFATANGLNKYDGYEFEVFQHSSTDSNSLSQSLVSDLFEDSNGTIWIATGDGLSRFNRARNNFKNYYPDSSLNSILGRIIQTIVEDDQGRIWVATTQGLNLYHPETDSFTRFGYADQGFEQISIESPRGDMLADGGTIWIGSLEYSLIKFDIKKKKFKQYIPGKYNENNRSDNSVTSLEKSGNILWIGTLGNGLFKLNLSKNEDVRFFQYKHDPANPNSLNNDNIMDLLIESESKIWIGTINYGLDLFNPQEGVFLHNMPDRNIPSSLNNGSIFSIYVDDAKNIWVGTYAGGVNVSYVNLQNIQLYRDVGGTKNSMSGNMVTSFLEDKKGNLWVGTDGGGLNYLNRKDNTFKKYSTRNTNLNSDAIHSLSYDKHGRLWLSTWEGGISRFDEKKRKFHSITTQDGLPDNDILSFKIDSNENIWAGCFYSGLIRMDMQGQILNLFNHRNSNLGDESIRVLHESRDGKIQIGTDGGVFIYDPRNETFKSYAKIPGNLNSLSSDQVFAIEEQDNGDFWFGTSFGLNKFNPATKRFIHFYKKDGLPSNMIVGLLFDYKGYLWISTDNGLAQMDVQQKVFKTYTISDGLQGNQFNAHSCYETRNNEILFGGTNGFNIFHPDSLKENTHIPPVVFTGFQIFNKPVKIGPDSPLKKHINIAKEINLTYKDYVFSLKFAALSYEAPERNQYAYKMEGFDEDWAYPGNSRTATYTNLSPGKYVFKVKASNNDGYWNQSGASIRINIKPPFWKTAWFRILVAILILSIAFTFHKLRMNNERSRSRLLEERVQERTKKLRALNEELESFAYSVSHDLRAPLRSITGFSKIIEEDFKSEIPEEAAGYLERINSAGKRMGLLIEDLLKLTRISRRELKKVPVNLSLMVREIITNLETAEPHRIVDFKFQSGVMAFGDRQLIYILLENILRNAWKYTKNEKRAEIEFGRTIYKNQKVYFVSDNGAGFDMAYSDKLFQPFMRLHNEDEFEGTGVGLATVKRIIDRHDGQIWAESAENEGTTIYFNFGNS